MSNNLFSVWEGVYNNFEEAGGDLDAFDSKIWINKQIDKAKLALQRYENNESLSKDYPLPMTVAMEFCKRDKISVLDFGGGMGIQYLEILTKVPKAKDGLIYHVVDGSSSINNIPQAIKKFSNLHFYSDINEVIGEVDIVHIGSTLQYIEDWKGLLNYIDDRFSPKYFVFSDLMAGNIPQFVSHQIFYDKRIPVWMFLLSDIHAVFETFGYELIMKSFFEPSILGNNILPNYKLPEELRFNYPMNLIYKKNE